MGRTLGYAALSCVVVLTEAEVLKRSDDGSEGTPAQETQLGLMKGRAIDNDTPVGAIVGGVVGGVVGLGLILLCFFLLRRRLLSRRRFSQSASPAEDGRPTDHGPVTSQVSQQPYPAIGIYTYPEDMDHRASIVKPNSGPVYPYYGPYAGAPSIPPQGQQQQWYGEQGYGSLAFSEASPTTQSGGFIPRPPSYPGGNMVNRPEPIELPVERGDGELRELQG
ncbi:hypothetical protein VTH82DRAFT_2099 [Thermothelomyces myriococcoides]